MSLPRPGSGAFNAGPDGGAGPRGRYAAARSRAPGMSELVVDDEPEASPSQGMAGFGSPGLGARPAPAGGSAIGAHPGDGSVGVQAVTSQLAGTRLGGPPAAAAPPLAQSAQSAPVAARPMTARARARAAMRGEMVIEDPETDAAAGPVAARRSAAQAAAAAPEPQLPSFAPRNAAPAAAGGSPAFGRPTGSLMDQFYPTGSAAPGGPLPRMAPPSAPHPAPSPAPAAAAAGAAPAGSRLMTQRQPPGEGALRNAPPPRRTSDKMLMEDVGHHAFEDEEGLSAPSVGGVMSRGKALLGGASLAPDTIRALTQLLWGAQGVPPASWTQGFYFNGRPGLKFGLVQRQGGPCGVLAAVQAHILKALRTGSGPQASFNLSPSSSQQEAALLAAFSAALTQAQNPGAGQPVVVVTVPQGTSASCDWAAMCRLASTHTASTPEELQGLLRACLGQYVQQEGWGIILFLMSLVLTKSIPRVQRDMDEPTNALMGAHGYCTQELVNLILVGYATSNVFDGKRRLDEKTILKGIPRQPQLGLLTLFEWYQYVEVGRFYKNPQVDVWVVCSESHFTVLFAADSRAAANQMPFDLCYYDELANQERLIRLTIREDPQGGWTARVGSTMGDRGKCEGQNIPPLECVIETRWPGVSVGWNGAEPIL